MNDYPDEWRIQDIEMVMDTDQWSDWKKLIHIQRILDEEKE